jgi:hypothetical protein
MSGVSRIEIATSERGVTPTGNVRVDTALHHELYTGPTPGRRASPSPPCATHRGQNCGNS